MSSNSSKLVPLAWIGTSFLWTVFGTVVGIPDFILGYVAGTFAVTGMALHQWRRSVDRVCALLEKDVQSIREEFDR